jgi:hypothetical protein
MPTLPRDLADLQLAPTALALEHRLAEMGELDLDQLTERVAIESNCPDWTREMRDAGLLATVSYLIDLHEWELAWDPRGLRMKHGLHSLVLGVPPSFPAYREGAGRKVRA